MSVESMNTDELIELEVNLILMLIRNNNHFNNDNYEIDYYDNESPTRIVVSLKTIPASDPFIYKLKIFGSHRVDRTTWNFVLLNDYRYFDNKKRIRKSVLYRLLADYNIDNKIKAFIILMSQTSNVVVQNILEYIKSNEENLYSEVTKFFNVTSNNFNIK